MRAIAPRPRGRIVLGLAVLLLAAGCEDATTGGAPPRSTAWDPTAIDAALEAAETFLDAESIAEAEMVLGRAIERAPQDHRARELMGRALILKARERETAGDLPAALEARHAAYEQYQVAADLAPDSAGLQHSAGVIAQLAGETEAAVDHFRNAAQREPLNPQHPLYEAQALLQLERTDEASRAIDRVLEIDPDEPFAHATRAMIALRRERYPEAREAIGEARRIDPDNLSFRVQEARIIRRAGDPRAALDLLISLPPEERETAIVAEEIAGAFIDLGDHVRAAETWGAVHRADPAGRDAFRAAVAAAEAWMRANRNDEARFWLSVARTITPVAPEVARLDSELTGRSTAP